VCGVAVALADGGQSVTQNRPPEAIPSSLMTRNFILRRLGAQKVVLAAP